VRGLEQESTLEAEFPRWMELRPRNERQILASTAFAMKCPLSLGFWSTQPSSLDLSSLARDQSSDQLRWSRKPDLLSSSLSISLAQKALSYG
jgi:hypothetical protein